MIIHESRRVVCQSKLAFYHASCLLDLCYSKFAILVTALYPLCRDLCATHPLMQEIEDPCPCLVATKWLENGLIPWFPVTAIKRGFLSLEEPEDIINRESDNRNNQARVINLWLTNCWSILPFKPRSKILLFSLWRKLSLSRRSFSLNCLHMCDIFVE